MIQKKKICKLPKKYVDGAIVDNII